MVQLGISCKLPARRDGVILHPFVQHIQICMIHKHLNLLGGRFNAVNQLPDTAQEPFRIFLYHLARPFSSQLKHSIIYCFA